MEIKNLSLSFGIQDVFNDVNISIDDNAKVGIVGVNGAGKTTFFRIILGELEPDIGKIKIKSNYRIGYLPQVIADNITESNETVFDFIRSARPIDKLSEELQNVYDEIAITKDEDKQLRLFEKTEKIQKKLDYWDSYSAESTLLKILDGMNVESELLDKKMNELSGGQKSKIAFAKLLYSNPEVLLLDEPTNHLDKSTKDFVTNYLKNYKGGIFVISHDINFLDKITNKILYMNKATKKMDVFDGNYSSFIRIKEERDKTVKREAEIQEKEIKKLEDVINKYSSASGKRKRMVLDREKKLEKILENKIDVPLETKKTKFQIEIDRESSNIPIRVSNLSFKYDKSSKNNIIDNLSFDIYKGEKFLIVGENGVGKSTLLKLIIGQLKPDKGEIIVGNKTDIGYYAQEHEILENDETILDNFKDIDISTKKLRSVLGRFLFYGDDVFKKIMVLSPGERSRVALAKLSLIGANLLILDEPTNHLDPETQMIIANTFKDYPGTMMIVSHNPEFVNNLGVERTLILPDGKLSYYDLSTIEHYKKINERQLKKHRR